MDQRNEVEVPGLLDTEKESLEGQHSNRKTSTDEIRESKIKELTDGETENLQKELNIKSKVVSAAKDATKNNQNDEKNGKDIGELPTLSTNVSMEESLEIEKNPLLLTPVIRCILKFLNIKDIKNYRFVSREWDSTGKVALASRGIIYLTTNSARCPADFHSCFQISGNLFSTFHISGYLRSELDDGSYTLEKLTKFFEVQQKHIKELTLCFAYSDKNPSKNIDISPWISKSPLVQKDAKHMTKLSILNNGKMLDIPLHLIAHIKDLELSRCRVTLEAGIKICPIKLKLDNLNFYQDGIKLDRIRINNIVDLSKAKEVILNCWEFETKGCTKCVVDLCGNTVLEKLILHNVEIVNGETSQWAIEHLATFGIPYLLNREMKIKELFLFYASDIDLFTLPNSLKKFTLQGVNCNSAIRCSQPIMLGNLEYLHVVDIGEHETDYSYLSHFMNCPQLTHLKLSAHVEKEFKSIWMPKNVKTLTLEGSLINFLEGSYLNLEKLVVTAQGTIDQVTELCEARIQVDDFVVKCFDLKVDRDLVHFLEYRNRFSFGNRLYIGKIKWDGEELKDSLLKELVDTKSSFYVFENGKKGRIFSEETFYELVPKHICIETW